VSTAALSRRSVLRGGGLFAAAGAVGFVVARRSDAVPSTPGVANAYGAPAPEQSRPLAALDEVPVDGGIVLSDRRVVLTRDSAGTVRGFSATCTHQGCTVSDVADGVIACPCHGSRFDASTGAVVGGPAPAPLRAVDVVVREGEVFPA
jgi:Rieske Fe-S protein